MGAIDDFVRTVQDVFANTSDVRAQARSIAQQMKMLLASPNLLLEIEERGGGTKGRINLHIDENCGHPGPGFCLMTSLTPKGQTTGGARAHDHGAAFVVYGVYKGEIQQTKYTWVYTQTGDKAAPELRPGEQFIQKQGEVAFFLPGEIHTTSAAGSQSPLVLRLESQLLDHVTRHAYNLESNEVFSH